MSDGMDTFAARLASFDIVLPVTNSRASSSKGIKPIAWPHSRPSPAELAHAGFYYKPYDTNPDNTACFLCERALDGWEEDDNPITEHLKHSPDCGWATMMDIQQNSSNPSAIQDPTNSAIVEARKATFGSAWPHDGKRGWVCQSDKMVEAGWYFCPHEESPDLASCAYCKLSLDGWEAKDDPFEEHYRRSSDCSFFVFAQPVGKATKKSTRSKKSAVSKASRLSTQSVMTTASEAPTIDDDAMDLSTLSQSTVKAAKSAKRTTKSRSKKGKKDDPVEVSSQMDMDSVDEQLPEPVKPKRSTRGKKRTSEAITQDLPSQTETGMVPEIEPPPPKRRATQIRSSQQPADDVKEQTVPEEKALDEATSPVIPKKGRKGAKKSTASKQRKTSTASTATKASLRSKIPDDSELEAAIEADLARNRPDADPFEFKYKNEPLRKQTGQWTENSTSASVASMRASHEIEEDVFAGVSEPQPAEEADAGAEVHVTAKGQKQPKRKTTTKKSKKKTASIHPETEADLPMNPDIREENPVEHQVSGQHDSLLSVEIQVKKSEIEPEHEAPIEPAPKKPGRKPGVTSKAKKSEMTRKADEPVAQDDALVSTKTKSANRLVEKRNSNIVGNGIDTHDQTLEQNPPEPKRVSGRSKAPPKTAQRYSDIPQEEHRAQSLLESFGHENTSLHSRIETANINTHAGPVQESTPSPSPQSSDAENRPPSTRPSTSRPPVFSPTKTPTMRIPLAASTPSLSPSKRQANTGYLTSTHSWKPSDIEEIFLGSSDDKENRDIRAALNGSKEVLTSPEKRMTVEEWITSNAKNGEERLKGECERLVGLFEKEGGRAMRALEGIDCID